MPLDDPGRPMERKFLSQETCIECFPCGGEPIGKKIIISKIRTVALPRSFFVRKEITYHECKLV